MATIRRRLFNFTDFGTNREPTCDFLALFQETGNATLS